MLKTFLILVLIFAGYRLLKNVRMLQKTSRKKDKTDYGKMDIQDADYKEINDE
ncbi:MAG TPA: hypothetical protein QGF08_00685 [Candidatus Marinimicrobia bacterium]|jgi:hypothetical protein|nr:hypothetical protein [Candidatus Neomarinimicrobiota bacterium]MDP7436653.1 hypothetical protein [Candidatus Neomarinimicrobiota bacterium]HJL74980.1 hypothetical protein [Candidatus Neomarinimicrobiota bacterium]HJM69383.1 hypothetical protein [Candidatus Neomarinimicrobiota bacterium]|tara:strand:- start:12486 stop:12644 length:159 start_codon:yes stop_codon:yes gene_type:complete